MTTHQFQPPYSVGAIANYILDAGATDRIQVTHLKLQKLVYMAYGMGTLFLDEPLFAEPIEAWAYGPVVRDLWHEFKSLRRDPIKSRSSQYDADADVITSPRIDADDYQTVGVLETAWEKYGGCTASELVGLTHAKGTPWDQTVRAHSGLFGGRISHELIEEHFNDHFIHLDDEYHMIVAEYLDYMADQ